MANYQEFIKERTIEIGKYLIESNSSITKASKVFGVSRNTVVNDIKRLKEFDLDLSIKVNEILKR